LLTATPKGDPSGADTNVVVMPGSFGALAVAVEHIGPATDGRIRPALASEAPGRTTPTPTPTVTVTVTVARAPAASLAKSRTPTGSRKASGEVRAP
jgi:hypothetical protein